MPAWHQARLPLHLIVTGLPSGLGIVLALAVALRHALGLKDFIDRGDMEMLARLLACAGLASLAVYAHEALVGLLLEDAETRQAVLWRLRQPAWWGALALSALLPQLLWVKALRRRDLAMVPVGILAAIGVWLDRWSLVVDGIGALRMPPVGASYAPSLAEWGLVGGSVALFCFCLILFGRFIPAVSMFETLHEETEAEAEEEER